MSQRAATATTNSPRLNIDSIKRYNHISTNRNFLRSSLDLIFCAGSIYVCFIIYGLIHERIYSKPYGPTGEKFNHSLFLVGCQSVGNAIFALFILMIQRPPSNKVPSKSYMSIAFSYIGAMFTSNLALTYMSYPAQALAKSCKIIPVMLMRIVVLGKRYSIREYIQVAFVTIGICTFMIFDGRDRKAHQIDEKHWSTWWFGIGLCIISLALDGWTGPAQEAANKTYKPTTSQMMFFMNFYAVTLVFGFLLLTGQIWDGFEFVKRNPEILTDAAVFSVLSALGQASILFTLRRFNSLVLATITTTRKFFTILTSVIAFGHQLSFMQWLGVSLVFLGLGLEIVEKASHKKQQIDQNVKTKKST